MKIPFYILGLLQRYGPQHGYSLKRIIEEQIAEFARIKMPTVYYHLGKLKEGGYVEEKLEREGNRPEKSVYSVTDRGKSYFSELMEKQLTEPYEPELPLDGALFFSEKLSEEELVSEMKKRMSSLENRLESLKHYRNSVLENVPNPGKKSTTSIFDHHICHFEAELEWLKRIIGEYR